MNDPFLIIGLQMSILAVGLPVAVLYAWIAITNVGLFGLSQLKRLILKLTPRIRKRLLIGPASYLLTHTGELRRIQAVPPANKSANT